MIELLIATKNKGKVREIKVLLKGLPLKITSLADYPDIPPVEEDGQTFIQNALKKAVTAALYTGKLTLGEDSGLEVKALNNAPGIYSARFSGVGATDEKNNRKLLRSLKKIPLNKRQVQYRCAAALVDKKKIIAVTSGTVKGLIGSKEKGTNGFGYDPLFIVPKYQKTFGELPDEIKAQISHRARALRKIKKSLEKYLLKDQKF